MIDFLERVVEGCCGGLCRGSCRLWGSVGVVAEVSVDVFLDVCLRAKSRGCGVLFRKGVCVCDCFGVLFRVVLEFVFRGLSWFFLLRDLVCGFQDVGGVKL